jgi:hypothetical protein
MPTFRTEDDMIGFADPAVAAPAGQANSIPAYNTSMEHPREHAPHAGHSMGHSSAQSYLRRFFIVTILLVPLALTSPPVAEFLHIPTLALDTWLQRPPNLTPLEPHLGGGRDGRPDEAFPGAGR